MILVNTDFVSGKEVETLSVVKGSTIQSKNIGRDIMAGLKTIIGGELDGYSEMLNEARAIATKRMVKEAEELKADAEGEEDPTAVIAEVVEALSVDRGIS